MKSRLMSKDENVSDVVSDGQTSDNMLIDVQSNVSWFSGIGSVESI